MLLRETGFTFNGVHSRTDMGLIYGEKDGHPAIAEIERNEYDIAGADGTLLLPGERRKPMTFEGTLYPAAEPATQAEAQALIRRVEAWLTAGRCPLIFDYEPEVFYLAELTGMVKWSLKNWFGGELGVKFTAQPWAYAVAPTIVTKETQSNETTVTLTLNTGHPAPLSVEIENTGTATITELDIGSSVQLRELSVGVGSVIAVRFETPVGVTIDGVSAMPKVIRFEPVTAGNGENVIPFRFGMGSSGAYGVRIRAGARGRW